MILCKILGANSKWTVLLQHNTQYSHFILLCLFYLINSAPLHNIPSFIFSDKEVSESAEEYSKSLNRIKTDVSLDAIICQLVYHMNSHFFQAIL